MPCLSQDWRTFRARLVEQAWTASLAESREGADPVRGSVGLVLNKASPLRVRDLTVTAAVQGFMSVFSEHTLQLGGPVHLDHVTLLHRYRGLQGAACVADGLYTGGLPAAVQLVQSGPTGDASSEE
ncbi:uncharacterized protein HaLaN_14728 [Haematococcus lacustris]|uniref:Uncharacterized protein n=1 Tax=Haematococcus lacustris TaxID=44745 RepID=A0A699ZFY3_HAELA|nr:uncharacterized protein HaLaN_14728 [Haematococcus lacustris]